ncbi:uncharacterized protein N7529_004764 [Penicillium soppii]|uniref:uncharacterized protein n=1 Tax=Penicillium soppii TaxID=69789 RepID=UPI002548C081|nr:uncharacterized protein N7529_004764 [Penicillium soppii]KAJ5872411.1 hypothetical protein N7529_004764 [Penicillium soppii]
MGLKAAVVLGLVPQLVSAAAVCKFSTAVSSSDTCSSFASFRGSTLADFQALNPGVSCPTLTAGQSYCVIGTVTADPANTTKAATTTKTTKAATTTASHMLQPLAGLLRLRARPRYHHYRLNPPADVHWTRGLDAQMPGISIELAAKTTLAQFRSWNTQIDATCTNLWIDHYVCTKA